MTTWMICQMYGVYVSKFGNIWFLFIDSLGETILWTCIINYYHSVQSRGRGGITPLPFLSIDFSAYPCTFFKIFSFTPLQNSENLTNYLSVLETITPLKIEKKKLFSFWNVSKFNSQYFSPENNFIDFLNEFIHEMVSLFSIFSFAPSQIWRISLSYQKFGKNVQLWSILWDGKPFFPKFELPIQKF